MKISVILPVILAVGALSFGAGYVLRDDAKVLQEPPKPGQQDSFQYHGPFVDVQNGQVNIGRRTIYELGWQDGYAGRDSRANEYQRGYDAGKSERDH